MLSLSEGADFNLPITDPGGEARLWVGRRAIQDPSVLQCKARPMPGADHTLAFEPAFCEWSTQMRTGFRQRIHLLSAACEEHRRAAHFYSPQGIGWQRGFR